MDSTKIRTSTAGWAHTLLACGCLLGLSACFLTGPVPATLSVFLGNAASSLCDQGLRVKLTVRGKAFEALMQRGETGPGEAAGRLLLKRPDLELNDLVLVEAWCDRNAGASGYSRAEFGYASQGAPASMEIAAPQPGDPSSPFTVNAPGPSIKLP
jgi:hypothetical protein